MKEEEFGCTGSCSSCAGCESTEGLFDENSPVITLTDDEGVDVKFEVLDVVVLEDGKEYLVVAKVDDMEKDDVEVVMLEIKEEDGEEVYDTVTDEETAKKVFDEFVKQQDSEEE